MGLALQGVTVIFHQYRFVPVLFVLFALIFIVLEILWLGYSENAIE
jgi:hypothetical protein